MTTYLLDHNFYFSAAVEDENLGDERGIYTAAQDNLQFHYGSVDYQTFSNHYSSEDWVGRKVMALPAMALGVIEIIFHLAIAPLAFLFCCNDEMNKIFSISTFCVGRDLQEIFGRFICLFNDEYGLYHLQESAFHKQCYGFSVQSSSYLQRIQADFLEEYPLGEDQYSYEWARTKRKLNALDDDAFREAVTRFSNGHFHIVSYERLRLHLIDFSQLTDSQFKILFPLGFSAWFDSRVGTREKLEALDDEVFRVAVTKFSDEHFSLISAERLHLIDLDQLTDNQFQNIFPVGRHRRIGKEKLESLSEEAFCKLIPRFSDAHFSLVPVKFFHLLDYAELTDQQIQMLITEGNKLPNGDLFECIIEHRIADLSDRNFRQVQSILMNHYPRSIPISHIPYLNCSLLTNDQIESLFPRFLARGREKFAKLSSEQVLQMFNKLEDHHLGFITPLQKQNATLQEKYNQRRPPRPRESFRQQGPSSNFSGAGPSPIQFFNRYDKHYEFLDVRPGATEREIKDAFNKLSVQCHPDKIPQQNKGESKEDYNERIKQANGKFNQLKSSRDELLMHIAS